MDKTEKILVRAPNWIGDVVMCLPALDALKKRFGDSEISVLAQPLVAPLFEMSPVVEGVIIYDKETAHRGLFGRIALAKELRAMGFSKAVLFQNAFDAAFIARLARVPERIGYDRDMRGLLLTKPVPYSGEDKQGHHVRYYMNLVKALGCVVDERAVAETLTVPAEEVSKVDEFLGEKGVATGRTLIGAAPGASFGPAKVWPAENFSKALTLLSKKLDATPIIFGAASDADASAKVAAGLKEAGVKFINLTGKVSLVESMAVMSRLRIFLSNDSGAMHVASALGINTVAVFGSTDPVLTGPLSKNATVVSKKMDCAPCFKRKCPYGHYECLTSVTPGEVAAAAGELVGEAA